MNDGNKYHGNKGVLKMAAAEGSPAAIANFVGFTATETMREIEGSVQGSDYADTDGGLLQMEITATVLRGKGAGLIRAGIYEVELEFDDDNTPGSIAGTFLLPSNALGFELNNNVGYNIRLISKGEYTITNPASGGG